MSNHKSSCTSIAVVVRVAVAFVLAATAVAADAPPQAKARMRNIVRNKLPAGTKVMGLEFTILKVDSSGGSHAAVDPEQHSFKLGDSFLVKIKPQDDAYVYVFTEGPQTEDGARRRACLLPESPQDPLLVKAGDEITLPENGDLFTFEPPAGEEKLVVVALKDPNPDLGLIAAAAFKETGKRVLSDKEREEHARAAAAIDGLRARAVKSVRTRGAAKTKKIQDAVADLGKDDDRRQLEVSPDAESESTEVIAVNTSEIIVDIPLRSQPAPRAVP